MNKLLQFVCAPQVVFAVVIMAATSLALDSPSSIRAWGLTDHICMATPGPFWGMAECGCPLGNDPVHTHDFCSGRLPIDGSDSIEFRWCEGNAEGFSCTEEFKSCGNKIYNCPDARCHAPPSYNPMPTSWGCHETSKPSGCSNLTYTWCDPVEYP